MNDMADSTGTDLQAQTWVEIDLSALRHNFRRFAGHFPPDVQFILSVKKQAYGHGLIEVARALENEPRLGGFAVASAAEALALRRAKIQSPILCFSVLREAELRAAISQGITLTITDAADARVANDAALALGQKAVAHIKIDTGMGRMGRFPHEALQSIQLIRDFEFLKLEAAYTHFADAWLAPKTAKIQHKKLVGFVDECKRLGGVDLDQHIGGSDALSICSEIMSGSVRTGIAVYGYHAGIDNLEPVMTLKSRVIYRRSVPAGTRISYEGTYTADRDSELALVGAGYGNGYPRILSNRSYVLINDSQCRVLGRVCMDQIIVDVTDAPGAQVGDEVVLFGRQKNKKIGADELAALAETIPYELLCLAGQINPRIYV